MNWSGKKVFVTGGAGFLGSNLCHALADRGARVTALDGFLFGGGANPRNLDGAEVDFVRGDIREIDLRPLCEGAAVIFNLAAQTSQSGAIPGVDAHGCALQNFTARIDVAGQARAGCTLYPGRVSREFVAAAGQGPNTT